MDENVKTVKVFLNWQKDALGFLENCNWQQTLISERCIVTPAPDRDIDYMVLNYNSVLETSTENLEITTSSSQILQL
jgi:hypothetical protein